MNATERDCDGCTLCCEILPIDSPDLRKQSGVLCANCIEGSGCQIYAHRPAPCRAFSCGWRQLAFVPEALRPDRSGVVIVPDESPIPPGYRDTSALKFVITDRTAISNAVFLSFLTALIQSRVAVFLAVPGPPGTHFAKAFLNPLITAHVDGGDSEALPGVLSGVLTELRTGAFEPVVFGDGSS
jgi:hypothetical protein